MGIVQPRRTAVRRRRCALAHSDRAHPAGRICRGSMESSIDRMTKHIGIVACTAEGASLCYRTICAEGEQLLGPRDHPEVSLHTHSLAEYMKYIERDDWNGVGDLMLSSANKLAKAGADFLICPDNTIHQAFGYVEERSPRPWLHIARVVADDAAARGFRRPG